MSQTDIFDTDDGDTPDDSTENLVTLKRSQIRGIEKKARERDALAQQVESLQRRVAFAEAGVPLGDKRFTWFIKGYDGDTDADSIRAALEESGLTVDAPPAGQTTVDGQVADQERRNIQSTLAAGDAGAAPAADPQAALYQAFEQGGGQAVIDYMRQQGLSQ